MHEWLDQALQDVGTGPDSFEKRRNIFRYRQAIHRLRPLNLRDRWGYSLEIDKLAQLIAFVEHNVDREGLAARARERGAIVEVADRMAIAMLTDDLPQFCSGYDTPAEDDLIETAVRTILDVKASS